MREKKTIILPNKHGHYVDVELPAYLDRVLFDDRWGKRKLRIVEVGHYWYRIYGWDKTRPAYGIEKDMDLLRHFLDRFAEFDDGGRLQTITDIRYHRETKNYYATFKMVDPYALAMEKAGLIVLKKG